MEQDAQSGELSNYELEEFERFLKKTGMAYQDWWITDDDDSWDLYRGYSVGHGLKVLKAHKNCPHKSEYWPSDMEANYMAYALRNFPVLVRELRRARGDADVVKEVTNEH